MMSEESATTGVCMGEIIIREGKWKLQLQQSEACMVAVESLKQLGPAARSYVCSHLETSSPEQKAKTDDACRMG